LHVRIAYDRLLKIMKIRYTRHAKNRMRFHKITEFEVETAINEPDFIEPFIENRSNVWIKVSEKFIRVTFKRESDEVLIITAVKKKKGWR